jgi:hypothetical protein
MARGPRATITNRDARESICIAWFRASHPDGVAVHSTPGNATGATGTHAIAARPPLEAAGPIDEGNDGFPSGRPANTALFRRLGSASALSALQSRLAIRPLAAQRSPFTISISMESRVEAARLRKRRVGLPSSGQRTLGTAAISGSRPWTFYQDRFCRESAASLCSAASRLSNS